jgi:heme O synthase-like polyprenyltransferase
MAGSVYLAAAAVMGIAFLALAVRFARRRTTIDARRLFFGSILYLPLLWILMAANRVTS